MVRSFGACLGHSATARSRGSRALSAQLGAPSLWDIDEGNNAEAAREMLESGNWVVPTFNFQLRLDKPALLYWLQIAAYRSFGINEFSARLPSALAAIGAVLVTYELGRRLFGAMAGLLAGLALAGTASFCVSAHFANPDALLNLFTASALLAFWSGYRRGGHLWFIPYGLFTGLAMLAKGPVGFVLPALILGLFLLWTRELRRLLTFHSLWGGLMFLLVVAPWYSLVGVETKANWLRGFFLTHNVGRFLSPMENHGGPVYYYILILLVGFAPWSVFLGLTGWSVVRELRASARGLRRGTENSELKFLLCWIAAYFVFFSFSGTKLPNYILPLFPALAILTARCLDRSRTGVTVPPRWMAQLCLFSFGFVGLALAAGLLIAGGTLASPRHARPILARPGQLGHSGRCAAAGSGRRVVVLPAREYRRGSRVVPRGGPCVSRHPGAWAGASLNDSKAPQPLVAILRPPSTSRKSGWRRTSIFSPAWSSTVSARFARFRRRSTSSSSCAVRCRSICSCRLRCGKLWRRES